MNLDTLDKQSALSRIKMTYPYLMIDKPGDPIALVVPSLETGMLPLLCRVDDVTYKVGSVSTSARTIGLLLRITSLTYHKDEHTAVKLTTAEDVLREEIM